MIKLAVFDFDGTLSNGIISFGEDLQPVKSYNIKDGMGLKLLRDSGIITGVISGWKHNRSQTAIIEHLKFDYVSMADNAKLATITDWVKSLNITLDQVAFMGDDVNDIEILANVGYSACPNDSVESVKDICMYKCINNGGYGAVREFCDHLLQQRQINPMYINIHSNMNHIINEFKKLDIDNIVEKVETCKGTVYTAGVGKSGNMARHLADLLKSVSVSSQYLETINTLHGDIGAINSNDIVLIFSKSGNTYEYEQIIPSLNKRCHTVGICCDHNSRFSMLCHSIVKLPFKNEIDCHISKIPTNSCVAQLLFCNILTTLVSISKNLSLEDYSLNHPSGNIGHNLKKIGDVINIDPPKVVFDKQMSLFDILFVMTNKKSGYCIMVDEKNNIIGLLTDGDIRRLLVKNHKKSHIYREDINTEFYSESDLTLRVNQLKKYNYVPILNDRQLIGVVTNMAC